MQISVDYTFVFIGVFVFNISSYEYYLSEDAPTQMTKESLNQWLLSILDGHVKVIIVSMHI